ncbi:YdeI/OmpD-associated family protein [Portibacter lacus]|uniref:DUF1905 domain-containing protein n=1 Tax=Portibacter lacus TaxID=1099794 RepID=A0AA37SMQ3_9BACT|nr:YdeI/OmpD-associated family protein [Portibacter lacus]GLR17251.1 hypothetical protein GCM10007940_18660 [Portibacter lacus]
MHDFKAEIEIIGINPFVFLPQDILESLFKTAGKNKGKIPVRLLIGGQDFEQTLIKYSGYWRLYLNASMRKLARKEVGDVIALKIAFDPNERVVPFHPKLRKALAQNKEANVGFGKLSPSLQNEISKYLSYLKTEESIERNIDKAIKYLRGEGKFLGRSLPEKSAKS